MGDVTNSHWTEGTDPIDYLSEASDGKVTEQQIATLGATDREMDW